MRFNEGRLANILRFVVVFSISVIFLIIAAAFVISFVPYLKLTDWDVLAFLGALIGGYITWRGVKITLQKQEENNLIKSINKQIKVMYFTVERLRFIHSFDLFFSVEAGDLEERATQLRVIYFLEKFNENFQEEMKNMIGVIDYNLLKSLRVYYLGFSKIPHIKLAVEDIENNVSDKLRKRYGSELKKLVEHAQTIFDKLEDHFTGLEIVYKEISKRKNKRELFF